MEINPSIPYIDDYDQIVFELLHNSQLIYSFEKGISRYFKSSRKSSLMGGKDIYHNGFVDRSQLMFDGDREQDDVDSYETNYGSGN